MMIMISLTSEKICGMSRALGQRYLLVRTHFRFHGIAAGIAGLLITPMLTEVQVAGSHRTLAARPSSEVISPRVEPLSQSCGRLDFEVDWKRRGRPDSLQVLLIKIAQIHPIFIRNETFFFYTSTKIGPEKAGCA